MDSIWKTPECEAWCRDFDYEDYLRYFSSNGPCDGHVPFSEEGYKTLCGVFEDNMEEGMGIR